jgi:DNA-binding NarL/FixJ family response regulator
MNSHSIAAPPARNQRGARRSFPGQQATLSEQGSFLSQETDRTPEPIRVLIALFSSPISQLLAAYLDQRDGFALIGGTDARVPSPEVVLVDYSPVGGIPAVHGATGARPVALSPVCDDDAFVGALRGGAWALLSDRPSPFEVTATVRQVAAGQCPILWQIARRPTLAGTALGRLRAAAFHPSPLSAREAAILAEVAKGSKNGVIGALFGLREQTVKNYLSEILRKTGAGNRAEAAALAVKRGWLGSE